MTFFVFALLFLLFVSNLSSYHCQTYRSLLVTGEHKTYIFYNGTSDTIENQKTLNIYKIDPNFSYMQTATFSFWFKPYMTAVSNEVTTPTRILSTLSAETKTYNKNDYTVNTMNYTSKDMGSFDVFRTYLQNYQTSFIFNVYSMDSTGTKMESVIGVSYMNAGSRYSLIIQTNTKSVEILLGSYFPVDSWLFVSIGMDYLTSLTMTVTVTYRDIVLIANAPLDSIKKFYKLSINLGGLSKYPNDFLRYSVCNCGISNFVWFVDFLFGLEETFELRKSRKSMIYYCNFNETTDTPLFFSANPPSNYLMDLFGAAQPQFFLGYNAGVRDYTFPYYDRTLMALQFRSKNFAGFNPGFSLFLFGRMDFTINFWFKALVVDSSTRTLLSSSNYINYRFYLLCLTRLQTDGSYRLRLYSFDTLIADFQIEIGTWYFFTSSVWTHLYSPKLFLSASIATHEFSDWPIENSGWVGAVDESNYDYFRQNIEQYSTSFVFGPGFEGFIKSFSFYKGSYQFPLYYDPNCKFQMFSPSKTYTQQTNKILIDYCPVCKSSFSYDETTKTCTNSKVCSSTLQHDFKDILGICESCYPNCKFPICGNGLIESFELCDDGLPSSQSGCSSDCMSIKDTWSCYNSVQSNGSTKTICQNNCANNNCPSCHLSSLGYWSCDQCSYGYYSLLKNGINVCVSACPDGYLKTSTSCLPCQVMNCSICQNTVGTCVKCVAGKYLDSLGLACFDSIPNNYYLADSVNKTVRQCSLDMNNCSQCVNQTYCSQCIDNSNHLYSVLSKSVCSYYCPEGYFAKIDGSGVNTCQPCGVANCSDCGTDPLTCNKCILDKFLDISILHCFDNIPWNEYLYEISKKQIRPCLIPMPNCTQCTNETFCTKCTGSPSLYSPNFTQKCVPSCPEQYYTTIDTNPSCQLCPTVNCSVCSNISPYTCTLCLTGKYLDITYNKCYDRIPSGFYLQDTKKYIILPCSISLCLECSSQNFCTKCQAPNYLQIYPMTGSQVCVSTCSSGYYPKDSLSCGECTVKNCSDCTSDPTKCSKCQSNFYLDIMLNSTCYSSKLDGYFIYNQTAGLIKACNVTLSNCLSCSNETFCSSCSSSYYLLFISPGHQACSLSCPSGYFKNDSSIPKACQLCQTDYCSVCSTSDPTNCLSCIAGAYYNPSLFKCYSTVPVTDYLLDASKNIVGLCSSSIIDCVECSSAIWCTKCAAGAYLKTSLDFTGIFSMQTCAKSCTDGYYPKTWTNGTKTCEKCGVTNCLVCNLDPSKCENCVAGKYMDIDQNTTCYDTIPLGEYILNPSFNLTKACNATLAGCAQCANGSFCLQCSSTTNLYKGFCSSSCPSSTYVSSTTESSIISNQCLPCGIVNCSVCTSNAPNKCVTCLGDKYKDVSTTICYDNIPATHYLIDSTTKTVDFCNSTLTNCVSCTNGSYCTKCDPSKNLVLLGKVSSMTCVESCGEGMAAENFGGVNICMPCLIESCSKCSPDRANCTQCLTGFYRDITSSKCFSSIPSNSFLYDSSQLLIATCNISVPYCFSCLNAMSCTSCSLGYLFTLGYRSRCLPFCPEGYYKSTNSLGNVCKPCQINSCSNCDTDPAKCNKCISGNYMELATYKCYNPVPSGFYIVDNIQMIIARCNSSLNHCLECSGNAICLKCDINFYIFTNTSSASSYCISECPEGYYIFDANGVKSCKACSVANCSNCSLQPPSICNQCKEGSYLDLTSNKSCYNTVPDGFFKINGTVNFCNSSIDDCDACLNETYCVKCSLTNNMSLFMNAFCVDVCPSGYYINKSSAGNTCQKCGIENCSLCYSSSPQHCEKCLDNKYIDKTTTKCYDTIPVTHYLSDSSQLIIETCDNSLNNCLVCSNKSFCLQCEANFSFYTVFNNITSSRNCLNICPEGYYSNLSFSFSYCEKCKVENCSKCSSTESSKCSKCADNKFLDIYSNNSCYDYIPNDHFLSNNSTNEILPCNTSLENCLECNNGSYCNKCSGKYSLSPLGQCVVSCPAGFYLNDTTNVCERCLISNCSDCYTNRSKCFRCYDNYYLDFNQTQCYDNVPSDYFIIKNNSKNIVKSCNSSIENCLACINETFCSSCSESYSLLQSLNASSCLVNCPFGYTKNLSNFCEPCKLNACLICTPDQSLCFKCEDSMFLDLETHTCVSETPSTHYKIIVDNQTNNEIKPCATSLPHCSRCQNNDTCISCDENYYFFNNSCQNCSILKGFTANCSEICGDGLLFNSTRSGHQCDDGNNINGDGCDSNCKIEANFHCFRKNSFTPDKCFDVSPVEIQLINKPSDPTTVILHPSRKLKLSGDAKHKDFLNLTIPNLDVSNYTLDFTISNNSNDIVVKINYKVTVKNVYLRFNLVHPPKKQKPLNVSQTNPNFPSNFSRNDSFNASRDSPNYENAPKATSNDTNTTNSTSNTNRFLSSTDNSTIVSLTDDPDELSDENNVTISEKYYTDSLSISLYPYDHLDEKQTDDVKTLVTVQSSITTTLVISTSGLSIFQALNVFWLMVDAMQIANFFLYINVLYPENVATYLKILSSANLNFIPNPFPSGTTKNDPDAQYKIFGDKIVDQRAPTKFDSLGKTSLFLKNSGLQVVILAVLWTIYLILVFSQNYLKQNNIVRSWTIHVDKFREKLEFGWFIQVHVMISLEFTLGCFLEIRDLSFENATNISSSILSIMALIYISLFLFQILRVVNRKKSVVLKDEEFKRKYDILFEEYQKDHFMQRNYPALVLIKKYLMVFTLVIFHDQPLAELIILGVIFTSSMILLLIGRPFKRKLTNAIMIFSETVNIVILGLIVHIYYLDFENKNLAVVAKEITDEKVLYGWVIITLISSVLGLYLIIYFRMQILTFMEFLKYLKESKAKYKDFLKDVFRKKQINKPILKTFISKGSLPSCEMVDPYKDISDDNIEKKYYHTETLPETSFSKYIVTLKTKFTSNNTSNTTETLPDEKSPKSLSPKSKEQKKVSLTEQKSFQKIIGKSGFAIGKSSPNKKNENNDEENCEEADAETKN